MAIFDLPLEKLSTYQAPDTEPADFVRFWKRTLDEARRHPLAARFEPVEQPIYKLVNVCDVTFHGFDGQPVKGWFIEPACDGKQGPGKGQPVRRPCLVSFVGYGGGRSLPLDHMGPAVAGLAHLVMDTRGQGSNWSPGDTADPVPAGPQYPGFMTRGIESPESYYYRRVFTDAVRAVEAAASHPRVDPRRIGVTGGSQGGGITIAAAGLLGGKVKLAMPDVPFLCHYRRATTISDRAPYSEIAGYLKCHRGRDEQVFKTLSYFDGVNFAKRITARSLFSVALMDMTCPPSTVFAAYNRIKGNRKAIKVYTYNDHEGGGIFQATERLSYAAKHL